MDFIDILRSKYNIDLNQQQQDAVNSIGGPCLLLSVPGGGKTTVVVSRIANMIFTHNINPQKILTLTFSKASAFDMKHRFDKVFGKDVDSNVEFSTIHSFCFSVISYYVRKMNKTFPKIIEGNDVGISKSQILKQIYFETTKEYIAEDALEELSNSISYVKNMLFDNERVEKLKTGIDNFFEIYKAYEKYKRDTRSIDFDDMLTGTYHLFKQNEQILNIFREKYHYINVDESQDTSFAQHELIKLLAYPKNNIFMVGDEDQSIYGFRAAFPEALLDFGKTYENAKVLLMERNYRSTASIVNSANIFIAQNKARFDKNMFTNKDNNNPIKFIHKKDRNDQYRHIITTVSGINNYSECAVLFRNNISAISLIDYLERKSIPFYTKDSNIHFFKHWILLDIISFIRLSQNLCDVELFEKIYYKTNSYISKDMFEYVSKTITKHKNIFEALLAYPELSETTETKVLNLYDQIKRIAKLRPYAAIEYIENTINYKFFIHKAGKNKGFSPETLNQVLDSIKTIASAVNSFEAFFQRLSHLQEIIQQSTNNRYGNAITLSTIHSSKGLEFDNVFLVDLVDGQFPSSASIAEITEGISPQMEEDVRLFYVGITRARNNLHILTFDSSNKRKVPVSRFVAQLEDTVDKINGTDSKAKEALNKTQTKNNLALETNIVIEHSRFGTGFITYVDERLDKFNVLFDNAGKKILSIKTCIEGGFIKILGSKK